MDNNPKDKALTTLKPLENMLEKLVQIITTDGRIFVGNFKKFTHFLIIYSN